MRACFRVGAFVVSAAVAAAYSRSVTRGADQGAAPAPAAKPKPASGAPARLSPEIISKPYTGDFDGMVKRRLIRVLAPYSKTNYFIDKGVQRGTAYEIAVKLEDVDQPEVQDHDRHEDSRGGRPDLARRPLRRARQGARRRRRRRESP